MSEEVTTPVLEKTKPKKKAKRSVPVGHVHILATFNNRGTSIEDRQTIYDTSFKQNSQKQIQWSSFLKLNKLTVETDFAMVVDKINTFIEPIFNNQTKNNWDNNSWKWNY